MKEIMIFIPDYVTKAIERGREFSGNNLASVLIAFLLNINTLQLFPIYKVKSDGTSLIMLCEFHKTQVSLWV